MTELFKKTGNYTMIQCNPLHKYINSHFKIAGVLLSIISFENVFQKPTSLIAMQNHFQFSIYIYLQRA